MTISTSQYGVHWAEILAFKIKDETVVGYGGGWMGGGVSDTVRQAKKLEDLTLQ